MSYSTDITRYILDIVEDTFDVDDVFNNDSILDYIINKYNVEDVFPLEDLEDWAYRNGFIKE